MIADLHIHSKYSYDSLLSPDKILKVAKKRGLNIIAITDHDTIRGGVETQKLNRDKDFFVIVGCEINTEIGDIIGLHLNGEIISRNSTEVIEDIKSQGGHVILPHPSRGHTLNDYVISHSDAIEVFNSRSSIEQNMKALILAKEYTKPFVAGSDAHFASEIGSGRMTIAFATNDIDIAYVSNEHLIYCDQSPWYLTNISQMIKSIKTHNFSLLSKQFFGIFRQIPHNIKK